MGINEISEEHRVHLKPLTEEDKKEMEIYFKEYFDRQASYETKLKERVLNKECDFKKTLEKVGFEYDWHTSFLLDNKFEKEEVAEIKMDMDALAYLVNGLFDKNQYDYPPFYEWESGIHGETCANIFFNIAGKFYVYTTVFHEMVYQLDRSKATKVKYYIDIDDSTVKPFEAEEF